MTEHSTGDHTRGVESGLLTHNRQGEREERSAYRAPAQSSPPSQYMCLCLCLCSAPPLIPPPTTRGAATADRQRSRLTPGSGGLGLRLRLRGPVQLLAKRVNAGRQALRYRAGPHTVTHSHLQCGTGCLSLFRFAPQAQQIPTVWVPREMNHASGIISDSLSFSSHSPAGSGVHAGARTRPSLRARVRICEAGRELNGRHSTIVKWHFSLHCTYSTYLPNPGALPPTHPPAQVRQQRINSKPVSEIGSCSIGKQSRSGHVTSRVAPPARYQGVGGRCACLLQRQATPV